MIVLAPVVGLVAGSRSMIAPAAIAQAAAAGRLHLEASRLASFGWRFTPWIVSLLAIDEIIADKLPSTPSRKTPPEIIGRIVTGSGQPWVGPIAAPIGAAAMVAAL